MRRHWLSAAWLLAALAGALARAAEPPPGDAATREQGDRGEALYRQRCASCHDHAQGHIPPREALRYWPPDTLVTALERGAMDHVAGPLGANDVRALATFLTGRAPAATPPAQPPRCADPAGPVVASAGDWPMIGRDLENTRRASGAGIDAAQLPRLKLRWAFAYPGGASGPPIVVGGRVFLASGTGQVFSLDARSGCAFWTHESGGIVRTLAFGAAGGEPAVFFGDHRGFATALDARTGRRLWTTQVEDHVLAKITAPPAYHAGRLYVPVSSIEDPLQHEPGYACCSFRGSVAALDATDGKRLWKTYTIAEAPAPLPRASADAPARTGPAGAAIWTPLTIDVRRQLVYAATGESYDDGNPEGAHAIVAYDLATGARRWQQQFKPEELARECRQSSQGSDCRNLFEFGAPVVLETLRDGRQILLAGQKSGFVYGLDPDAEGRVLWQARPARGGDMGGIMYGLAVEAGVVYAPIADPEAKPPDRPGGLAALDAATGRPLWRAPGRDPRCSWGTVGCSAAEIAAATAIPGAVFSGAWDGHVRAYAAKDGARAWDFDTGRSFDAVNGGTATGGQVSGWPVVVANGAVYVTSGASSLERPGNALLVFGVDGR